MPGTDARRQATEKFPVLGKVRFFIPTFKGHDDHPIANHLRERGWMDKFPPTMRMNHSTSESAYVSALKFCSEPSKDVDWNAWDAAMLSMKQHFWEICGDSPVISADEAESFTDLTKTNGWPDCMRWQTKQDWYDEPSNRDRLRQLWDVGLVTGNCSFFNTYLEKHELRTHDRVQAAKVRGITPVATDHVQSSRRIYTEQFLKLHSTPLTSMTAFGFNPYRGGAQALFSWLADYEEGFEYGFEADVSAMDSNVHQRIADCLVELDIDCIRDEDRSSAMKARVRNLKDAVYMGPIVMPDGMILLKGANGRGGNTSGQLCTAYDNTRTVVFYWLYAYKKIMKPEHGKLLSSFRKLVRFICLGDDVLFSVHNDIIDQFNIEAIALVLRDDLGVKLETPKWYKRRVVELRFLAFGFGWEPDLRMMVHVLDPQRVISSIIQGGSDSPENGRLTPHGMLQRLAGIRISSWGDPEQRKMVWEAIRHHKETYKHLDNALDNQTPWETAKKSVLSDAALRALYSGYEAEAGPDISQLDKSDQECVNLWNPYYPALQLANESKQVAQSAKTNPISSFVKNHAGKLVGESLDAAANAIHPHINTAAEKVGGTTIGKKTQRFFENVIDRIDSGSLGEKNSKEFQKRLNEDKFFKAVYQKILKERGMPKSKKGKSKSAKGKSKKGKRSTKPKKGASRKSKSHKGRARGGGGRSSNIARGMPKPSNRTQGNRQKGSFYSTTLQGSSYLGAIHYNEPNGVFNAPNGAKSDHGTLMLDYTVHPAYSVPKVKKELPYWHLYAYKRMVLRMEGVEGTNMKGGVIISHDPDVSEPAPQGEMGYISLSEKAHKVKARYFDKLTSFNVPCPPGPKNGKYWIDQYAGNDPRSVYQQKLYMMVETSAALETGTILADSSIVAHVWLDWTIEFSMSKENLAEDGDQLPIVWTNLTAGTADDPIHFLGTEGHDYGLDNMMGAPNGFSIQPSVTMSGCTFIRFPLSWSAALVVTQVSMNTSTVDAHVDYLDEQGSSGNPGVSWSTLSTNTQAYPAGNDGVTLVLSSTAGYAYHFQYITQVDASTPMDLIVRLGISSGTPVLSATGSFLMVCPVADPWNFTKRRMRAYPQGQAPVHLLLPPHKLKMFKMEQKLRAREESDSDADDDEADRKHSMHIGLKPGRLMAPANLRELPTNSVQDVKDARADGPTVSLKPRAETKQTDGELPEKTAGTVGKQGIDCKHQGLPDQERTVGWADRGDGQQIARVQVLDEFDRPVDLEELPDKPQRPIERSKGASVSESAGAAAFDERGFKLFGEFFQWFTSKRKEDGPVAKQQAEAERGAPCATGGAGN